MYNGNQSDIRVKIPTQKHNTMNVKTKQNLNSLHVYTIVSIATN